MEQQERVEIKQKDADMKKEAGQTKEGDIEASMKRLEEILDAMEQPEVTLMDSLRLYKEGVLLAARCQKDIADVEKEIEVLDAGEDM